MSHNECEWMDILLLSQLVIHSPIVRQPSPMLTLDTLPMSLFYALTTHVISEQ